jgi:hypothetical protein
VAFVAVHVTLALLVPQSLVAMITGGPVLVGERAGGQLAPPAGSNPKPYNDAVI